MDPKYLEQGQELLMNYVPKVLLAIAVLVIGLWLIARVNRLVKKILIKRQVDATLIPFLSGLVNITLKVLLVISVASMVGIATTSFVAALGAAGLAIGLALQGSLANFAGGVLLLLFKPLKVGDVVEIDGEVGAVKEISILNTVLTTPADNTAIIPNGIVANNKILNYTQENTRRVDLSIGIGYDEDVDQAKEVLVAAMKKVPKVLENPEPFVGVTDFGDSSVNLAVRPFCNSADYWDVYFAANEAIKKALDDANIEIPYPHSVEIHKEG
jgi:small conductance mechanosensitive channel